MLMALLSFASDGWIVAGICLLGLACIAVVGYILLRPQKNKNTPDAEEKAFAPGNIRTDSDEDAYAEEADSDEDSDSAEEAADESEAGEAAPEEDGTDSANKEK